jgi:hypothetical protein
MVKESYDDKSITKDNEYDEKYDSYTIFNSYKTQLVLLLFIVIFIFIIVFSLLGSQTFMDSAKPWLFAIEIVLWVILISIIVLNIKTIKSGDIDFTQQLMNLFGYQDPEINVHFYKQGSEVKKTQTISSPTNCNTSTYSSPVDEVFHIPQNIYKYEEADDVCKLFDARLATYDEIERAYDNGGSWCSYGWSADQLALFPTQKEVYNELKKIPGHKHDCGRPGINGGYFKNKNLKFGVNCYGKKPYITTKDKLYIKDHANSPAFDKINEQKELERKRHIDNILVAPFNKYKWSEL